MMVYLDCQLVWIENFQCTCEAISRIECLWCRCQPGPLVVLQQVGNFLGIHRRGQTDTTSTGFFFLLFLEMKVCGPIPLS